MSDTYSADTEDLDAFAERSGRDIAAFRLTLDGLEAGRSRLATLPLPAFVSSPTLDRYRELITFAGENGRFAADVSDALKEYGVPAGGGLHRAEAALVDAALARSDSDRLDAFEADLIAQGVDPEVAAAVRAEVAAQLAADPTLGFGRATVAGLAAHQGITVDEAERAARAFELFPAEVAAVVEEHFDEIAGRHGSEDQITLEDLRHVIEDDTLPPEVRDAAYRLAADQVLFTKLDVTKQTDLSSEPLGNGFDWLASDGIIGRDDVAQFGDKEFQARVLLAWHPLVETAGQGYDLGRVDSHASADDVTAFVEDEDIPVYVRLAVFDVYAERHGLELDQRQILEQELAFDGRTYGGGRTVFDVGQTGQGRAAPVAPVQPASGGPRGPGGRGSGGGAGGAAVAAYAQVLLASAEFGWNQGRRARIAREGSPAFVATDPLTGHEVSVDPSELAGLTPAQAKAFVAHLAATGVRPSTVPDEITPHPYLDRFGQWRMSDTNEPVWPAQATDLPAPGQYTDLQGVRRWIDTNQPVELFPNRPQYEDEDGVWRWADTGKPVDRVAAVSSQHQRQVSSRISNDRRLVREAQRLGSSQQRSMDALTAQLANGNLNPGRGTKHLFNGVFEARSRDGARLYFMVTDVEIVIVGKSTKHNQPRVISILKEIYG